jgi:hypothetical protein
MPLINIFFWVILILLILLSFQLVYSFSRAEYEIMRQLFKRAHAIDMPLGDIIILCEMKCIQALLNLYCWSRGMHF